ncbi:hypothetical protein BDZ97DRAFT_1819126 [Flammula alnicola]|nr:hypothetical protein BDZ97DRAFT_1819126 [Flammula alnicola]
MTEKRCILQAFLFCASHIVLTLCSPVKTSIPSSHRCRFRRPWSKPLKCDDFAFRLSYVDFGVDDHSPDRLHQRVLCFLHSY